jgi:hypothetical protein
MNHAKLACSTRQHCKLNMLNMLAAVCSGWCTSRVFLMLGVVGFLRVKTTHTVHNDADCGAW